MAFFNYATMQIAAKVVYYGPGLCGKTTNLQFIYNKTSPKSRGEMVSLETETDRTLFFDLLPLEVGVIGGFRTRFQLYTVPGQVFYAETRRMVLKGVDGIVFVADSQTPMADANLESMRDLESNLKGMGVALNEIPMVLQYNKRDLKNIMPVQEIDKALNIHGWEAYESSALNGTGVFETLKGISRLTLMALRKKLDAGPDQSERAVAGRRVPAPEGKTAGAAPPATTPAPMGAAKNGVPMPLPQRKTKDKPPKPSPVPEITFETLKSQLTNQELAQKAPKLKTVSVAGKKVSQELDRIRDSLLGPILGPQARPKVKDLSPALEDLKKAAQAPKAPPPPPELVVPVTKESLAHFDAVQLDVYLIDGRKKRRVASGLRLAKEKIPDLEDAVRLKLTLKPKKT